MLLELSEGVVLTLDPGDGLLHVGQVGALQQIPGAALAHEFSEDGFAERLRDGLSFLL